MKKLENIRHPESDNKNQADSKVTPKSTIDNITNDVKRWKSKRALGHTPCVGVALGHTGGE